MYSTNFKQPDQINYKLCNKNNKKKQTLVSEIRVDIKLWIFKNFIAE